MCVSVICVCDARFGDRDRKLHSSTALRYVRIAKKQKGILVARVPRFCAISDIRPDNYFMCTQKRQHISVLCLLWDCYLHKKPRELPRPKSTIG